MAAENSPESQDEKEVLVKTGAMQEAHDRCQAVAESSKQNESKLTLYHWTQSFNSQKVSVTPFQHHSSADSSSVWRYMSIWWNGSIILGLTEAGGWLNMV